MRKRVPIWPRTSVLQHRLDAQKGGWKNACEFHKKLSSLSGVYTVALCDSNVNSWFYEWVI